MYHGYLVLAENKLQYEAISKVFDNLTNRRVALEREITNLENQEKKSTNIDTEVDTALDLLENLTKNSVVDSTNALARDILSYQSHVCFYDFDQ